MDDLLDRIAAGPPAEDLEQLRVYADVLIERGDPIGELIVVATQRRLHDSPELSRREAALLAAQAAELTRALARPTESRTSYLWRCGFVDTLQLTHGGDEPLEACIPALAARREARLLRRLEIHSMEVDGRGDLGPVFAELARHAASFPRLVEIVVREGGLYHPPPPVDPIALHDVSPLYAAFPRLEVLELGGEHVRLGDIVLPSLRRLMAVYLRTDDVRPLVTAQLPALADLELWFRDGHINYQATFGPLMYRDFGSQLTSLSIGLPWQAMPWFIAELPELPIARHVRRLAFRHIKLDEGSLLMLMSHAPKLRPRLEALELLARPLSASFQKNLRQRFGGALVLV